MGVVIDELQVAANRSLSIFQRDVYQLYDEFNFTPVYIKPLRLDFRMITESQVKLSITKSYQ